jgi:hypothetical protein
MRDDRDYKVELASLAARADAPAAAVKGSSVARPHLNVQFACCNVYVRVYRSHDGASYRARCPKCAKAVTFQVQPGGSDARIFRVE